jgi:hypothetical protein
MEQEGLIEKRVLFEINVFAMDLEYIEWYKEKTQDEINKFHKGLNDKIIETVKSFIKDHPNEFKNIGEGNDISCTSSINTQYRPIMCPDCGKLHSECRCNDEE